MSDTMPNSEPLPGYRLIRRLGTGGYGEVWSAEAPGGLEKAVKLVFGTQHEKRATHEMRSLNRIRELRHPFLLSLERIEIVDGRLIVVTELADESLKDRFDCCRQKGEAGIPREELLRYVQEAADALDFMCHDHSLQHLDVKPENLLLVAGHVKVADFGLVKDIQQSQASIVGGMTPVYSAPEVFRGSPSNHSDQYSLAILFQEMLTGTLPFPGVTAAELTLQHLNDEPCLGALQGADRYIVSRALAKDPSHRYATCKEFVAALCAADNDADWAAQPASPSQASFQTRTGPPTGGHCSATEVFDEEELDSAATSQPILIDLPTIEPVSTRELEPIDLQGQSTELAPTVIIGIGGTGGRVLRHLAGRLQKRFGGDGRLPALRLLLLDSDPRAVVETTYGDHDALCADETLALPLRRPQHYRENSTRLLKWLSRRWLFNIPKSMRTEGLRPLGRLTLVDHARQVCQRIRHSILQAIEPAGVEAMQQSVGLPVSRKACRVYVVSSISGGTGSGMSIDLAYAIRAMLEKCGIETAETIGILTHSTGRDPRFCDLARVNAYSWLNEYAHFLRPGCSYPGDESCGLPSHEPETPPFDHTYLIHLGEGLGDDDFDQGAASVAEYVLLDTLTPVRGFLAASRQSQPDADEPVRPACPLRTFGLHRTTAAPVGLSEHFAEALSHRVVASWLDSGSEERVASSRLTGPSNDSQPGTDVERPGRSTAEDELLRNCQLDVSSLAAQCQFQISAAFSNGAAGLLHQALAENPPTSAASVEAHVVSIIDGLFRKGDHDGKWDSSMSIGGRTLSSMIQPVEEQLHSTVNIWLKRRLDVPQDRLVGARQSANWLVEHLQSIGEEASRLQRGMATELAKVHQAVMQDAANGTANATGDRPLDYLQLRLDQCALLAVNHIVRLLIAEVKSFLDQLNLLARELTQIARRMQPEDGDTLFGGTAASADCTVDDATLAIAERLERLMAQVDAQLQSDYLDGQGGLLETVLGGGRPRAQMFATLRETAHQVVNRALDEINLMQSLLENEDAAETGATLASQIEAAMPRLLEHGGASRTLLVLPNSTPDDDSGRRLARSLGTNVSTVIGTDNSFAVCVEAEQLPLTHVAVHLVQRRRDYVELAERVHSRSDIAWTNLTDGMNDPISDSTSVVFATQAQATDDDAAMVHATQMLT